MKPALNKFTLARYSLFFAAVMAALSLQAETWHATVGTQDENKGRQVVAFLPNELWIHAGDSIEWRVKTDEPHTITFLTAGQIRQPFDVGCPGYSSGPAIVDDGRTCVSSPPLVSGQSFSVMFTSPGNFKLVCLVHPDQTGVVHVLETNAALPHGQEFYDREAASQANEMLADLARLQGNSHAASANDVVVGTGKTLATGGGHNSISLMRFMQPELVIRAGTTVEWTNDDPSLPHTITFGTEPANPMPPSGNVSVDADGALHATISSTADSVHSGFILSAPQDEIGSPQTPLAPTRFRITFTKPGVYPYICALHDELGMKGRIIVLP
ncbi:MAG TPA: plastocyanin/azurin family copper-binding protein [Terriglobales bacterium]|nr:plastocyanin/azurin family copper-binding protein [Terriglobales bacterium]